MPDQISRGKWISEEKKSSKDYLHGLDKNKTILCITQEADFGGDLYDDLIVRASGTTRVLRYLLQPEIELEALSELLSEDGRAIQLLSVAVGGDQVSWFEYEGDRLVREEFIHEDRQIVPGERRAARYLYDYDGLGLLSIHLQELSADRRQPLSEPQLVYRRPKREESLAKLSKAIQNGLVSEIPKVVQNAGVRGKVYCLLLVYDLGNYPLPPTLALGLDEERQQVKKRRPKAAAYDIWNPAELQHFNKPYLEFDNSDLHDLCHLHNQEASLRNQMHKARSMLNNVAQELAQYDWKSVLDVTHDFVVAATDLEAGDDLLSNMNKSVPSKLRRDLRDDGWLDSA